MSVLFVRLPACLSCFCLSLFFLYLSSSPYPILCPSFSLLLSHFPPFLFFLSLYSHSSPNPSTLSPLLPLLLFYPLPPLSLPLPVPFSSPAVSRDTPCRKAGMQKPPPLHASTGGRRRHICLHVAASGGRRGLPHDAHTNAVNFYFPLSFSVFIVSISIYLSRYIHAYVRTYIHTCRSTYIYTYIRVFFLFVCRVCVCVSVYMCVSLRACVFMRRDSNFRSHDTASRAKTFRTFRPTPRIRRGRLVEA